MGNQQLIPLVLAALIVSVAIVRGIGMFQQEFQSQAEKEVQKKLLDVAGRAQMWYRKPAKLGGGGRSFAGISWKKIDVNPNTSFATFIMSHKLPNSVRLTGASLDDPSIIVSYIVYADSVALQP